MKRTRLKSYLKTIVTKHGIEVLSNGQKTVNLIAVTFKNSLEERQLLKTVYEHNAMEELLNALSGDIDALTAYDNAVAKLTGNTSMNEEDAGQLIKELADAIKLPIPKRPKAPKPKPEKVKLEKADNITVPPADGVKADPIPQEKPKTEKPKAEKPKIDTGAIKEKLGDFKTKVIDKGLEWFKSLKLEENAKQMVKDSKLGEKVAGYLLNEDRTLGERGKKIIRGIAIIVSLFFAAQFFQRYMILTQYVGSMLDGDSAPFVKSLGEYVISFIVFFLVNLRCELKNKTDYTDDKLFKFYFWVLFSMPLLASLGNGVGLITCVIRALPACGLGFLGLVMGKIAGKDMKKRINWSKKYIVSASVICLLMLVLYIAFSASLSAFYY